MTDNDERYAAMFREAAEAIQRTLEPRSLKRAMALGRMEAAYIGTPRDWEFDEAFDGLIENCVAQLHGKAGKRRALFVLGESGSGKTTAVEKHFAKRAQFMPRKTADGELVYPFVCYEAPKPLTLKGLAINGLKAIGYEVMNPRLTEQELFDIWKKQLREKRVLYLWIDEMQHVLRGNTTKELQNVADIVKSLLQIAGWPLHIVLSGVPTLARFLRQDGETERQLKERSFVIEMKSMTFPEDVPTMRKIFRKIIEVEAGLLLDEHMLDDEFIHRIMHASHYAFGSMIQLTRGACTNALRREESTIATTNFARAYAFGSGCRPSQNIFLAKEDRWESILPANSLDQMIFELAPEEVVPSGRKKKETR